LSPATNNRAVLRNAFLQADFGDGTSLYEAVGHALNRQLRQVQGRKAIVLFSDGVDTTSKRASYQSTVRQAEELDALIYSIRYDTYADMQGGGGGGPVYSPYPSGRSGGGSVLGAILGGILGGGNVRIGGGGGGGGSGRAAYETGRRYMDDLARNSGGRSFQAQTTYNLETAFGGIAEELRRQYSIGYYPEAVGQAGQRKQISVRVSRPNAVVRAKNSYIVGASETGNANRQQTPKSPTLRTPGRLPF